MHYSLKRHIYLHLHCVLIGFLIILNILQGLLLQGFGSKRNVQLCSDQKLKQTKLHVHVNIKYDN